MAVGDKLTITRKVSISAPNTGDVNNMHLNKNGTKVDMAFSDNSGNYTPAIDAGRIQDDADTSNLQNQINDVATPSADFVVTFENALL